MSAHLYAARFYEDTASHRTFVSPPLVVASNGTGASIASYDAYASGSNIKALVVYGASDGSAFMIETSASFANTIDIFSAENDIYSLMLGVGSDLSFIARNNGFESIHGMSATFGGETKTDHESVLLPGEETMILYRYTPSVIIPDSIEYTITAHYTGNQKFTASGAIACR